MLKKLFGLAPKLESDGSYSPSALALKLATSDTTDFEPVSYTQYRGKRSKVLVIFTEQKNMKMQNGALLAPLATRIRPHRERERERGGDSPDGSGSNLVAQGRRRPTLDDGFVQAKRKQVLFM